MMPPFLQAMRPHQWVKNLLVMAPLAFTPKGLIFDLHAWGEVLMAFASFCLAASSIYLLNDIVDREEEARHPKKRLRPIASGRLPLAAAPACTRSWKPSAMHMQSTTTMRFSLNE